MDSGKQMFSKEDKQFMKMSSPHLAACLGSYWSYHPQSFDHLMPLELGAGPVSWISPNEFHCIRVQEFRGGKKGVAFMKSEIGTPKLFHIWIQ